MKTLFLDCSMGAAGDMLAAALLELLPDPDAFLRELNALGIPGVKITREPSIKCGISGTHVTVTVNGIEEHEHHHHHDHDHEHHHEHHHSGMHDIEHIVSELALSQKVRRDILAVYQLIADAESRAHGVPVTEIHFHEVGTMDAVADITAVCMLMDRIAPEQVAASPVHTGSGHVHCAHGILPVPAPATAYILQDVPIYGGSISGELCTPTGAALLKHFVSSFGEMPVMRTRAIGCGMGKKDFPQANCLRAMLGDTETQSNGVLQLSCTLDDMTAEEISFAMDRLFDAGALDVCTIPAGMKKSRPGVMLQLLCRVRDRDAMVRALFRYTSTLGIRETALRRYVLDREIETLNTPYGQVRRKTASGYGVSRSKLEFDDLAQAAKALGVSLAQARRLIEEHMGGSQ